MAFRSDSLFRQRPLSDPSWALVGGIWLSHGKATTSALSGVRWDQDWWKVHDWDLGQGRTRHVTVEEIGAVHELDITAKLLEVVGVQGTLWASG
jgi:hypothetical protein